MRGKRFVWFTHYSLGRGWIISNYWMRLSRIWRILQVEESVIHLGLQPRWITPSEICRILHILRKPNSIIASLFIRNIFFAQTCRLSDSRPFLSLLNEATLCPGFLGHWFNNLWRQWFNNLQRTALLTLLVQYDRILGHYSFKIFPRFWLVKTARIIHHKQLLLTKNSVILNQWRQKCSPLQIIESLTSKIIDSLTEKTWAQGCVIQQRENSPRVEFTSLSEENFLNE